MRKNLNISMIVELSKNMLVVLIGPTAAGKDTLLGKLDGATSLVSHTTRPIREVETDGVEYHFITEDEFDNMEFTSKRFFHTIDGVWKYGLSVDESQKNGVTILDYEGFLSLRDWRKERGLDTAAVLVDIDYCTAKKRYMSRGGDLAEFERRWVDDEVWLGPCRNSVKYTFSEWTMDRDTRF